MQKSDHHVCHLHPGVVDVVLHVHFAPRELQQAHKCVAKNCVAEMSNMRSLVRIDAGVLNQNFAGGHFGRGFVIAYQRCSDCGTINAGIDVARSGNFKFFKALDWANTRNNLFRNFSGSLSKLLRQLKSEGQRKLAEFHLRRLFDDDSFQFQAILPV